MFPVLCDKHHLLEGLQLAGSPPPRCPQGHAPSGALRGDPSRLHLPLWARPPCPRGLRHGVSVFPSSQRVPPTGFRASPKPGVTSSAMTPVQSCAAELTSGKGTAPTSKSGFHSPLLQGDGSEGRPLPGIGGDIRSVSRKQGSVEGPNDPHVVEVIREPVVAMDSAPRELLAWDQWQLWVAVGSFLAPSSC